MPKNQYRPQHWTDCLNRVDCRDWQCSQFKRARDLSAWLGLVPKQYSTGGKSSLGEWVARLEASHHHHVVLIALANKIMRICWKVPTSGRDYQPYPNASAAVEQI
ncbi:transposase [Aeromonas veronii]|uniref:transposase n=1 Tax=Aeromonas veronii TaxID=654 RepID=UPI00222EA31E|nr:transposase [Aeromonas veronii]UZE61944.1 transposase [Aeromonas veronii]